MLVNEGDVVEKGMPIAETKPLIKWFKTTVESPIDGTVESISEVTGHVLFRAPPTPLELKAFIDGTVVAVREGEGVEVETRASFIQGIFGVGGERAGDLFLAARGPDEPLPPAALSAEHRGKVVVGGSFASLDTFKRAQEVGAAGLIVGGISAEDLKDLLGYDLGVAITGTERIGFTLVVTEGFGKIAMARRTFDLLAAKAGKKACISGATQIRAGVIRPEVIVPDPDLASRDRAEAHERGALGIGDAIRIIRMPWFGRIGVVTALPSELQRVESGTRCRVLEVAFDGGKKAVVPRANVELIEA
jgi:hypothetical protein